MYGLTYDFSKFSKKLNEIERIWTLGGLATPLDPPLIMTPDLTATDPPTSGFELGR